MPHCTLATVPPTRNSALSYGHWLEGVVCCHPLAAVASPLRAGQAPGHCGQQQWVGSETLAGALLLWGSLWFPAAPPTRGGLWSCSRSRWQAGTRSVTWQAIDKRGRSQKRMSACYGIAREAGEVRPLEATAGAAGPWMRGRAGTAASRQPQSQKPGPAAETEPLPAGACKTNSRGLLSSTHSPRRAPGWGATSPADSWQSLEMDWFSVCLQTQKVVAALGWE